MEYLSSWPASAWAVVLPLLGNALWKPATAVARWLVHRDQHASRAADRAADREAGEAERLAVRVGDLEELVDLLRRALDKHLIRESAVASGAEHLVGLIEQMLVHVPEPTDTMLRLYDRALDLLRQARAQTQHINEGGA